MDYTTDSDDIEDNVYLKHEVVNGIITSLESCLRYNNNEFCLGPNYWDTNGTTTMTKLQTAMETALGTSAAVCSSSGYSAECDFGDFNCKADSNGGVLCRSNVSNVECPIEYYGSSFCRLQSYSGEAS